MWSDDNYPSVDAGERTIRRNSQETRSSLLVSTDFRCPHAVWPAVPLPSPRCIFSFVRFRPSIELLKRGRRRIRDARILIEVPLQHRENLPLAPPPNDHRRGPLPLSVPPYSQADRSSRGNDQWMERSPSLQIGERVITGPTTLRSPPMVAMAQSASQTTNRYMCMCIYMYITS